jgi:ATP-dependent protease HslVU (ClpYQ) peptidase subunit
LDEFFTAKFIPALRECFDAQGYSTPVRDSSNHMAEQSSDILVSINQTIYQVDNDYAWSVDSSGIFSIGTGSAYALGALAILCSDTPTSAGQARNVALKALAIAAKYDPHTGYPYQVFTQSNKKKESSR